MSQLDKHLTIILAACTMAALRPTIAHISLAEVVRTSMLIVQMVEGYDKRSVTFNAFYLDLPFLFSLRSSHFMFSGFTHKNTKNKIHCSYKTNTEIKAPLESALDAPSSPYTALECGMKGKGGATNSTAQWRHSSCAVRSTGKGFTNVIVTAY